MNRSVVTLHHHSGRKTIEAADAHRRYLYVRKQGANKNPILGPISDRVGVADLQRLVQSTRALAETLQREAFVRNAA